MDIKKLEQAVVQQFKGRQLSGPQLAAYVRVCALVLTTPPEHIEEFEKSVPKSFKPVADNKPPLPDVAEVLYRERKTKPGYEHLAKTFIVEFLQAVYGPWLDGALTRAKLRELDPVADEAIEGWISHYRRPFPIWLPVRREVMDTRIANLGGSARDILRTADAALRRGLT